MNEFKVGLLSLIAIVAIVFMSLKITSNQGGFGPNVTYQTIINNAAGIFPKTPIKVAGINAGRIVNIKLTGSQALVTFEVSKNVKVTKYTIIRLKSVGLLGDKYIDIFLGNQNALRLPEGTLIPSQTGGGLDDLTQDASEILADVKAVIKSIKESISPEGRETPLIDILESLREVANNSRVITKSLRNVVQGNEFKLDELVNNIHNISKNLSFHTDAKQAESLFSELLKVGKVLDEAKIAVADFKVIVNDVKAGKGTVGKLLRDDQVIDQVSETLSGVKKMVNKFSAIQTDLSLFSTYNTGYRGKSDLNLNARTSPERFFRLGFVSSEYGIKKEKEIIRQIDGAKSIENRSEQDKNTIKFNLQIGRSIHNWGFRAGIMESTGGVGIDYNLRDLGANLSLEAFDFSRDYGPHLRFATEYHLWNIIYGRVAAEGLITKKEKESLTIGAGLRFTDDDVKGLLGLFLR